MSRQSYKKSHSSRKEWEDIFQKKSSCTNPRFCARKSRTKHYWTGIFCSVGFSLLGRICNPTAISMSICNAENGKRKRIINPYTNISMSICNAENGKAKADYKSLY